jgi:hypothetical protein
MRMQLMLSTLAVLCAAGSAQGAIKFYDSSANNGTPSTSFSFSEGACPPARTTPDEPQGFAELEDGGLGTVTLKQLELVNKNITDLGEDALGPILGPGAFIFVARDELRSVGISTNTSNASGVGAHGPSGTAPGETTEWGITSGWIVTGATFCVSSPVEVCNQNGFAHGATTLPVVASPTYDLGTWNFDGGGDYEAEDLFIQRTSNGGLTNRGIILRGAFHGASLPALPLIGFGALALGLGVLGTRAILGRR